MQAEAKKGLIRTLKYTILFVLIALLLIFARPTLPSFIGGTILIAFGELIRIWATGHIEKNKKLTTTGPYAYVKNPMYIRTFFIGTGFCITARNYYILAVGLALFFIYYIPYKKRVEARRLKRIFGDEYIDYDKKVSDLIPRLTPYKKGQGTSSVSKWHFRVLLSNNEQGTLLAIIVGLILMGIRFWLK